MISRSHKQTNILGAIPACLEASVDAAPYHSRRSSSEGGLVDCGGSFPGCCSHSASTQKAFTALYLGILQPKKGQHALHPPNLLRVRVAMTVLDT
jgi:hypothetical protein